jgi:hypothetical protein
VINAFPPDQRPEAISPTIIPWAMIAGHVIPVKAISSNPAMIDPIGAYLLGRPACLATSTNPNATGTQAITNGDNSNMSIYFVF